VASIAYNSCLNHLEKKNLLVYRDAELPDIKGDGNSSDMLDLKQRAGIVTLAIEQLPPVLKTLITLYHNEDLSYAEIQQITQLPEGTIKSYLFRARKALKENLLRQYKKEEI